MTNVTGKYWDAGDHDTSGGTEEKDVVDNNGDARELAAMEVVGFV